MAKFWLCAAVGFYLLPLCLAQIGLNISCRYAGVFHVEKNRRYSLTREDAVELCKALNSTIPTSEQMQKAFDLGFETCRYGYIEDKVVVPRHTPYHLCAANTTGIYILSSNISDRYDTYCFNSSETREKVCDPVIKLYSVLPNNNNTIEIFNADGSHYIEGEKYTNRPPVTEDETSAGSGSANDRGTTEPNFIRHGISQYPHPADSSTIPNLIGRDDEVSDNYEEGNSEDQHPKSTTVGVSNNGKHHDNATQGQQVPEDFPLWWSSREHEERHKTTSRKDESTEENDDDGGGDDGDDDNEEGSGQINRETVLEWNNSGDQEPPPSNTTVVLSKDIKHEDSAHDSFLHGVHSEKDSEVRYSTNGTKEDVPPGIGPLSDDEHYPTTTAAPLALNKAASLKLVEQPLCHRMPTQINFRDETANLYYLTEACGLMPGTKSKNIPRSTILKKKPRKKTKRDHVDGLEILLGIRMVPTLGIYQRHLIDQLRVQAVVPSFLPLLLLHFLLLLLLVSGALSGKSASFCKLS